MEAAPQTPLNIYQNSLTVSVKGTGHKGDRRGDNTGEVRSLSDTVSHQCPIHLRRVAHGCAVRKGVRVEGIYMSREVDMVATV